MNLQQYNNSTILLLFHIPNGTWSLILSPPDGALHKLDCPQFLTTHQAVDRQWIRPRVIIIHAMWRSYYGMNMKGKVDCYMMNQRNWSVYWNGTNMYSPRVSDASSARMEMINPSYPTINSLDGVASRAGKTGVTAGGLYQENGGCVAQPWPLDAGMGRYEGIDGDRRWVVDHQTRKEPRTTTVMVERCFVVEMRCGYYVPGCVIPENRPMSIYCHILSHPPN